MCCQLLWAYAQVCAYSQVITVLFFPIFLLSYLHDLISLCNFYLIQQIVNLYIVKHIACLLMFAAF